MKNKIKYISVILFIIFIFYIFSNNNQQFSVRIKIAKTDNEKKIGLMFRKYLNKDEGMLFKDINSVWMKNTFIPLDVIFLDENYRVVGYVTDTVPLSLDSVTIDKKSQHLLEVNSGFVKNNKINIGDRMHGIIISELS